MKSKDALEILVHYATLDDSGFEPHMKIYARIIKKDLEVLEIIKNKCVYPMTVMSLPYELYNKSVMKEQQLTEEEYNKIKEWLENL